MFVFFFHKDFLLPYCWKGNYTTSSSKASTKESPYREFLIGILVFFFFFKLKSLWGILYREFCFKKFCPNIYGGKSSLCHQWISSVFETSSSVSHQLQSWPKADSFPENGSPAPNLHSSPNRISIGLRDGQPGPHHTCGKIQA